MWGNSLWFSQENHPVEEVPVKDECFGWIAGTLVCISLRTRIRQYLLLLNQLDLEMFRVDFIGLGEVFAAVVEGMLGTLKPSRVQSASISQGVKISIVSLNLQSFRLVVRQTGGVPCFVVLFWLYHS